MQRNSPWGSTRRVSRVTSREGDTLYYKMNLQTTKKLANLPSPFDTQMLQSFRLQSGGFAPLNSDQGLCHVPPSHYRCLASSSHTAPSLRQISLWAKPTHVITLLVVLADWFGVLLSLAEHRFVEIGLRHSAVVGHVVASHHVRTSDSADRLVVKSRWRRIQDNPPFAVDSTVSLEKQVCRSSLLSGRNVCWPRRMLPLVSHDEYADGTDGRTPDRYVALSVGRGQHNKWGCNF